MSKASRINKNDLKIYNLYPKNYPKKVRRKEMTLKHYRQQRRWLERTQRKEKRYRNNFFSLSEIQLALRRGKNEKKKGF